MPYNIHPSVDELFKFPPEIRNAMKTYSELVATFAAKALETTVGAHIGNAANPHGTTKAQVGLGNVDNTSDVNKPVSGPTQTALAAKAPLASPTFTGTVAGITKAMVGLGNVDNTSDANKPLPNAVTTAMASAALGIVAQSRSNTVYGPYGNSETVYFRIPTFTFKANRVYMIEANFEYSGTVIGNFGAVNINTDDVASASGAVNTLTKLGGSSIRINDVNMGENARAQAFFFPSVDTTLQIKATTMIWGGAGTLKIQGAANNPITLTIYDEGTSI